MNSHNDPLHNGAITQFDTYVGYVQTYDQMCGCLYGGCRVGMQGSGLLSSVGETHGESMRVCAPLFIRNNTMIA